MWTEIARCTGGLDGTPDRHQRPLEAQQLFLVRRVIQYLAISEVDESQPGGQHAARPQQRHRVELHLEHRLELCLRPGGRRSLTGLVVDHPQLAGSGDIDAVDESAQQGSVGELDLYPLLAALRVEPCRVFQPVVAGEQRARLVQQLGAHRGVELRSHVGFRGDHLFPRGLHQRAGRVRPARRGGQPVKLLQHDVHHRPAQLRGGRRFGQPIDCPEAVQQRALLEVRRPRRRQRRPCAAVPAAGRSFPQPRTGCRQPPSTVAASRLAR